MLELRTTIKYLKSKMTITIEEADRIDLEENQCRICSDCGEIFSYDETDEDIPFLELCPLCDGKYLFGFKLYIYEYPYYEKILNDVFEEVNKND